MCWPRPPRRGTRPLAVHTVNVLRRIAYIVPGGAA